MEKSQQIIMSLRNILLQPAAINFKEIFLDTDQESGEFTLKQGIQLPPCLFEDILRNGKEIGWPVSPVYILPCIPFRTELKWENVDLSDKFYAYKNIIEITNSTIPIRCLSINTNDFDLGAMVAIKRFAPTLESLEIFSKCGYLRYVLEKCDFKQIKFPKLKRLRIESHLSIIEFFNLKSCSDSLELLFLNRHEYFLKPNEHSFAGDLKNMKNLKYLFLFKPNTRTVPELMDSIQSLKNLKFLQIGSSDGRYYSPITSEYMINLINSLPNLERLGVVLNITYEAISWLENYFNGAEVRALKYLGSSLYRDEDKYLRLSQILKVGAKTNLEAMLTRHENSYFDTGLNFEFETLYYSSITSDAVRTLESILFGYITDESRLHNAVGFLSQAEKQMEWRLASRRRASSLRDVEYEFRWSQDFKRKIMLLSLNWLSQHPKTEFKEWSFRMISSEQMQNFIFTYILTNPKNILSRLLLRQSILKTLFYDTHKVEENEDEFDSFEILNINISETFEFNEEDA